MTIAFYSNILLNNRIFEYAHEGIANCLAIMGRAMTRLSYLRKMAWLTPRLQRAVPYLGYLLVVGEKPASSQGAVAQAEEVAEEVSPERMS